MKQGISNNLPAEVSTHETAKILGVSKDTVLRLKKSGLLEYRNAAPPDSSRPVYRFTLESVLKLRMSYTRDIPFESMKKDRRRKVKQERKTNYIQIHDD